MSYKMEDYQKAATMMPGSVILFSLNHDDMIKVFFFTKNTQELTGLNDEEVKEKTNINGLHYILQDDRHVVIERIKEAIQNQHELDIIYRQVHKTYNFIWVHMKARIVGEEDGQAVFFATMLNVTHEMQNSNNIMESSNRGICVIEKNTKILLYANQYFYDLNQITASNSIGVHCYDVLCKNLKFKTNNACICYSSLNVEKPLEYYDSHTKKYLSIYGKETMWGEHAAYVFYLSDQTQEKFNEKQLISAQERFEMTLNNSDLYVWEYDMINHQCINSKKAEEVYHLPKVIKNYPESLFDSKFISKENIEQLKEIKQRLFNGETGFSYERKVTKPDGTNQWLKIDYTLQKDRNDQPIRALVCATDITGQKEKEIYYEEEIRRKKTIKNGTEILAVADLTNDCIIERSTDNPLLMDTLKLKSINSMIHMISECFIYPTDKDRYFQYFNREHMLADYKNGIMHNGMRHQFVNRDGWYESNYDLVFNPHTGCIEAIASIKDITELVRTEYVVNKLVSIDYDIIMTLDIKSGKILSFENSLAQLNIKNHDYYYEDVILNYLTKHADNESIDDIMARNKIEVIVKELKYSPTYTTYNSLFVNNSFMRVRNIFTYLDQSHKTLLCARQDITESYLQEQAQKKALNDALDKVKVANEAKTVFLSRVSHDMRTPLNGILGITSLMKDNIDDSTNRNDLKQLELSGKYLLDLINDVLDVSSIESGKMELHPIACEGMCILENALKLMKPSIAEKHIHLIVNRDELVSQYVYVDESRLQQLAVNLLGNAVKFTPNEGHITLTAKTIKTTKNYLFNQFIIQDDGIGMTEEFLPHLFEPFAQENAKTTNSKKGTGLGMSIVKHIIELMDGTIEVESKVGQGTKFTINIRFPLATQEQINYVHQKNQINTLSYNLQNKRVLLCEDHPLNASIAIRLLNKVGVKVEHAENGQQAIDKFNASIPYHYDAILMDIRMPIMDGIEATQKIRSLNRQDATIPIIAMTANALIEDKKRTKAVGMNDHLSKPIDPEILYSTLHRYINKV